MRQSGLADSPFFRLPQPSEQAAGAPPPESSVTRNEQTSPKPDTSAPSKSPVPTRSQRADPGDMKPGTKATKAPHRHATMTPRYHDTMASRHHDTIVGVIRKAVREYGKEAATHRFTADEKKAIADIIYSYKRRGIRTSENQVARIAVNFIVSDYRENGENSVLHRALEALNT